MGITGGLTARYISEKYFAMICGVQVELNYAQRGWDEKFDQPGDDRAYSREMNYMEMYVHGKVLVLHGDHCML